MRKLQFSIAVGLALVLFALQVLFSRTIFKGASWQSVALNNAICGVIFAAGLAALAIALIEEWPFWRISAQILLWILFWFIPFGFWTQFFSYLNGWQIFCNDLFAGISGTAILMALAWASISLVQEAPKKAETPS